MTQSSYQTFRTSPNTKAKAKHLAQNLMNITNAGFLANAFYVSIISLYIWPYKQPPSFEASSTVIKLKILKDYFEKVK